MGYARLILLLAPALIAGCAANPDRHTLAELSAVEPDLTERRVEDGLEQAMQGYRSFLAEAPESELTPDAMRRLADLKVEKEYGILGDGELVELPAPEAGAAAGAGEASPSRTPAEGIPDLSETEQDFERRTTGQQTLPATAESRAELELPEEGPEVAWAGPLEAIELYDRILASYPHYEHNDQVLYQKARAFDELGRTEEAMAVMDRLIVEYPSSRYIDEVQFRRAEYFFTRKKYLDAEHAYGAIVTMGEGSEYYELALYKLGWTLYKQDMHDEALDQYVALLDYKVSTGYDFDQDHDEANERRVADTFRVISLSFSNLGGPEAIERYFAGHGNRGYEDRIYSHLAEFYFEKLRYHDAAQVYKAFVALNPLHKASPHFGMRVVEIYEAGGFPKLVLESKKEFAEAYGLQSEYWRHFDVAASPEVLSYLKGNLEDLANHYHALYQDESLAEERQANYREALQWYYAYLGSFPGETETPGINHRLADLLLEHEDYGEAAREYERTAYAYPPHDEAAAAGYAAIYAHREHEKIVTGAQREQVRSEAVESTLRFVDRFPDHEHAAVVLGAAVDDLYAMQDYERAIANGHRLIDGYPGAEPGILRAAWTVVAHASFDTARYPQAEQAYARVLEMTPAEDETWQAVVDNLAAAIYKQGEAANETGDYRAAADHFLRIRQAAPTSSIRPAAEYDAGAALIRLEEWAGAATVFDDFREAYPEHELQREATKQIAYVYREDGQSAQAAAEYERVAAEAEDPELRADALLVAGELYEKAALRDSALDVYLRYVDAFPRPVELAVETRHKIAGMYREAGDLSAFHEQLRLIVEADAGAGEERTNRTRYLAATSALTLSEQLYHHFGEVRLVQPFEQSLQEKQQRMDAALAAFEGLVDYEVGEVTAAATFYIAEIYFDFSQALIQSERPTDLSAAELQDYEIVIEEEAFPFEERAIEVHEKNLELLSAGVFNPWVEKSLDKLADLMPGRYAKFESSSGFIDSIDSYAYHAPLPPVSESGTADPDPAPAEMAPEDGGPALPAEEPEQPPEPPAPAEQQEAGESVAAG